MNKIITVYELLGLIKDKTNYELYIKYFDKIANKEQVMWACEENIFDKLDNKGIFLNDKVKILEEDKPIIEKIEIEEDFVCNKYIENEHGARCHIKSHDKIIIDKLNEIIDYINKKEKDND